MSPSIQLRLDRQAESQNVALTKPPPRISSADLLRGQRKLIIEHGEAAYVLLLTCNGRLILNK